jgi:hypothetical protein
VSILALADAVSSTESGAGIDGFGKPTKGTFTPLRKAPEDEGQEKIKDEDVSGETSPQLESEDVVGRAAIGSMSAALKLAKAEHSEVGDIVSAGVMAGDDPDSKRGPSSASVRRTMESIASEVKKCRRGTAGQVMLKLEVSGNTGRVLSAESLAHDEVGVTAAQCAVRAVKLAKFPPFEKSRFTVTYTFDI